MINICSFFVIKVLVIALKNLSPIYLFQFHQNLFMMYKRCLKHLYGPRKAAQILCIQENATNELENIAGNLR